jgi:hypothetical protein
VSGPRRERKIKRLLDRDGPCCHWCGAWFSVELPPTLEHLIPRHNGGLATDDNLVLACGPCNNARRHRVSCAGCGNRIRKGGAVGPDMEIWHAHCLRRVAGYRDTMGETMTHVHP